MIFNFVVNDPLSQADIITHHDVPKSEIKAMDFWRANHLNLIPYAAQLFRGSKVSVIIAIIIMIETLIWSTPKWAPGPPAAWWPGWEDQRLQSCPEAQLQCPGTFDRDDDGDDNDYVNDDGDDDGVDG